MGIQGELYIGLDPWVFPTLLSTLFLFTMWPKIKYCGVYGPLQRNFQSSLFYYLHISARRRDFFPNNWWMIILEVRSSLLGCDLMWFATSQGNASRLGWPSNILVWILQERGHLVYFKTQNADKWENRFPSLCQCSQQRGKRPCHLDLYQPRKCSHWLTWAYSPRESHARWLPWPCQT